MRVALMDINRFNGFVKKRMKHRLEDDLVDFLILNERELHFRAYHHIEDFFSKKGRDRMMVRSERRLLKGKIADIVVSSDKKPRYVLEFKMYKRPNHIDFRAIESDLKKLQKFVQKINSLRWAFLIILHDADGLFSPTNHQLRKEGFNKISIVPINARILDSGRKRKGYDKWRRDFDRHRLVHE